MINKLIFLFFLILTTKSLNSQVAVFWNEEISENEIILIGPLNVSKYFIGQSEIYIAKYKQLEIELEFQLEKLKEELKEYELKTFRNASKLGNMNHEIQLYYLNLEILHEFISIWENHKEKYLLFQESFAGIFEDDNCYCFETNEDVYCAGEATIEKLYPNESITYKEIISGEFKQVSKVLNHDAIAKKRSSYPNNLGIRLDDETTHYEIIEKNIQELLQYRSKPRKDDEEIKENTITDEGLELIERYFTTMNFDEQERVLAINVDYLLNKTTIQVIVNDNGTPIIPENFKKINCD